ncbi:hypothetical protein [Campylobacter jejuni]|uniref:hypothetical protein n=1 Tax=Campylobacter jejuni TaxID=197 RepID=UPI000F80E2CB|nr:hypothetical protein [Campylobacter jejuni]RTJ85937.1 hypothetical protein C3H46_09030 [Campylobacter jejuni]
MFKFSKKSWIIIFILVVLYVVISNIYELFNSMEADNNKARENLSALIKWSKNEGKEELEYAKNLSKENYNQEKVTQMIIKNLKMIQASIEDIRTLTSYYPTEEDVELMRQAGHVTTNSNTDIILYLLYNERNITNHKTYFLFDKERFDALEDFLFFLNTRLEEDFLQNKIKSHDFSHIVYYTSSLIGNNWGFSHIYIGDLSKKFTCKFDNSKTAIILNTMRKLNKITDNVTRRIRKDFFLDNQAKEKLKENINKILENFNKKTLTNLNTLQSKLKECTNE